MSAGRPLQPELLTAEDDDSEAAADAAAVSSDPRDRSNWPRLRLQNFKGDELDFLAPYTLQHMRFRGRIFCPRPGQSPDADGIHHYIELTAIYDLENHDIITPSKKEKAA